MGSLSSPSASAREEIALAKPSKARLKGFPRFILKPSKRLFRAHRRSKGPWWFSSSGTGRFDLTGSKGTCYLANSAEAALREALGGPLVKAGVIERAELDDRVISTLAVENSVSLADTTSTKAANHGMTKEISTVNYQIPQAWAKAWDDEGMNGVRYSGRFGTGHKHRCYALFGAAGASMAPLDPAPQPATKVANKAGIRIVTRPITVTIIPPPS